MLATVAVPARRLIPADFMLSSVAHLDRGLVGERFTARWAAVAGWVVDVSETHAGKVWQASDIPAELAGAAVGPQLFRHPTL